MTLRRKLLPTFTAIAAGQTATCNLDLGKRYHIIWLELGNNAVAANALSDLVNEIRVKINGKVQRTHTAVELNACNGVNGSIYTEKTSGTDGQANRRHYLPIYFAEPWRNGNAEAQAMALNAVGINSFSVELDVKAGLAAPIVQGFYEYDSAVRGDPGYFTKWIRQTLGAVGTVQDFNTIDRRDFLQAIHLFPTTGTSVRVNSVKFTLNGEAILDAITTLENQAMLLVRGMNPDTAGLARFDLVFDHDDPINNALATAPNGERATEMTLHVEYSDNAGVAAAANGNLVATIIRTGQME